MFFFPLSLNIFNQISIFDLQRVSNRISSNCLTSFYSIIRVYVNEAIVDFDISESMKLYNVVTRI